MTMRVGREDLLKMLEAVSAGLSKREIVEQSSCFVFKKGRIYTYNDEVSCMMPKSGIDLTGAVRAEPLLGVLNRMVETDVEISQVKNEFVVAGKGRGAGVQMDAEIALPLENVEKPKEWTELPSHFSEAVGMVAECASRDESAFVLSCIHIHPKWIEACDNIQASRYRMPTGIAESFLVKASALKCITGLGMTHISETPSWVHFKNPIGLRVSCRRWFDEYLPLTPMFKEEGVAATLPKGLGDAAETARIFSSENADRNLLEVVMKPGRLTVKGQGTSGWYKESKKLPGYDGEVMRFLISPNLLIAFSKKHNECELSDRFLKVERGKFVYVTLLGSEDDVEEAPPQAEESENDADESE